MRPVFKKLSQYSSIIDDTDLSILEKFVITMHDKCSNRGKVDEARLEAKVL